MDSLQENIENNQKSLNAIAPYFEDDYTAGWTAAIDMQTEKFIALPSDPMSTKLVSTNANPTNIVPRQGGHNHALQALSYILNADNNTLLPLIEIAERVVGFNIAYPHREQLIMGWKSNVLNLRNTRYAAGHYVLPEFQALIITYVGLVIPDSVSILNR